MFYYDMFADFYQEGENEKPVYRCPMGVMCIPVLNYFLENGFVKDIDYESNYVDYHKDIDVSELPDWVQVGYVSELMSVLYCGRDFGRIVVRAEELDVLDDEGMLPVRGCTVGDCFVRFSNTDPLAPVTFLEGNPYEVTDKTRMFTIPLVNLEQYFGVLTMMEVIDGMRTFSDGNTWSFEQLKDYFEAGVDEAVELALRVFHGKRDLDGNPVILHALSVGMKGKNKTQMVAGFLHDVVEDTDITLENLAEYGFSKEVLEVVRLLTHGPETPYEDYVMNIINARNMDAIAVKMNDLNHNLERGKAGGHTRIVKKHTAALNTIKKELNIE